MVKSRRILNFLGLNGSSVRANLVTGLSRFQFNIGAPEAIKLGTGKQKYFCLNVKVEGRAAFCASLSNAMLGALPLN
jgi:hypothetical protein